MTDSGLDPGVLRATPVYRRRVPPLPAGVVARPLVSEAILSTGGGAASVVESAPGYGATTAVAQALMGAQVQWLSLGNLLSDDVAARMVGELLSDTGSDPTWLVVDGLVPEIHRGTRDLLAEASARLPRTHRLIVTAPGTLEVPGAQVFDEALLEFSDDEAMELLVRLVDGVDVDAAAGVIDDAKGWVSALVAGAYRIRGGAVGRRLGPTLPGELLNPWLESLDPDRRRLLHDICVVDEFCVSLVEAITESGTAHGELMALVRAHSYTKSCPAPDEHGGQWWTLHPMLRSLLRQRSVGQSASRHSRAALWFAETDDIPRGMDHYIAAGRYRDAVELLDKHQDGLLSKGSAEAVLAWYGELERGYDHRIESLLRAAWGNAMSGDIPKAEAARARLRAEVEAVGRLSDVQVVREQVWLSEQALLESYLAAFRGDPATVVRQGQIALDFPALAGNPTVPQLAPLLIARGHLWSGDYARASDAFDRCASITFSHPSMEHLHYPGARAMALCQAGEIDAAAAIVDRLWSWARSAGFEIDKVPMFAAELARATVLLEQGRLDEAREVASVVGQRAAARHHLSDATMAALVIARAFLYSGQTGQAFRQLSRAADMACSRTADSALRVPIGHVHAQAHMAAGDMLRAERLLRELPPSQTRSLLSAQAGLARSPVLSRKSLEALSPRDPRAVAMRHLLLAVAFSRTSNRIADEHLRAAAVTARRNGLRMLLAPPEPGVRDRARRLAETGDEDVAWVLKASPDAAAESPVLSRGDLQLLAMIPTRAKNSDIAVTLGISVNTVKTRLRRLYANLGVTNRDEAIAVARERGLVP